MIRKLRRIVLTVIVLWRMVGFAQPIHDSDIIANRQISYASVTSQNDLYQGSLQSDKYFTNGLHLEFADQILNNKISRFVLINGLKNSNSHFAVSLGQDMYTPLNIYLVSVDSTDIPYSGAVYFTFTRQSNDHKNGRKLITKLFFGVQGPIAGAGDLQLWYHQQIGSPIPNGWDNQISNGLIFDYEVKYERLIPISTEYLEMTTNAIAHIGSYQNFIQAGVGMKVGLFNFSFTSMNGMLNSNAKKGMYTMQDMRWFKNKRKSINTTPKTRKTFVGRDWQVYGLVELNVVSMFYNGAVQGSLIPFKESPYLYRRSDFGYANGNLTYGITVAYKQFFVQYKNLIHTDVYKGTGFYGWGQIQMAVSF
ncbi:MAG: lipid A-modifier LpxR family protein [Salibacteraceae bacterium]